MQRGDILFFAPDPTSAVDRLVIACQQRAGYPARFVHCEVAIDERYSVGAIWPQVRIAAAATLGAAVIVTPPWRTAQGPDHAADWAIAQIGVPYNVPGLAALGVGLVVPAWKHALTQDTAAFTRQLDFCSQLAARFLLTDGVTPPDPAAATSPAELAAWLKAA